jgi:plasmid stabilization system protein ParE
MVVRSHAEAEIEAEEARSYYEAKSPQVAFEFWTSLGAAADQMVRMPYSAPMWPDRPYIRCLLLRKYRYKLVYSLEYLERDEIFIVALAHTSRTPGYWLNRLH